MGQQLTCRAALVEGQGDVQEPVGDSPTPGALGTGCGQHVEPAPDHDRHGPDQTDGHHRGHRSEQRLSGNAVTVQPGDDHLVGDATYDHGEAHHGQGEHVGPHDPCTVGPRVHPQGPPDEPPSAAQHALGHGVPDPGRRVAQGRTLRVGRQRPRRTPSTSPRWPRPSVEQSRRSRPCRSPPTPRPGRCRLPRPAIRCART